MHKLTLAGFLNCINKPDKFIYFESGTCQFHILLEGQLFLFKTHIEDIESPEITPITDQLDVDFGAALNEAHPDYIKIQSMWLEGVLHHLFLVFHSNNMRIYNEVIATYFAHKLVNGYQHRADLAILKCINHLEMSDPLELSDFSVSKENIRIDFGAKDVDSAKKMATSLLLKRKINYSSLIVANNY